MRVRTFVANGCGGGEPGGDDLLHVLLVGGGEDVGGAPSISWVASVDEPS
jgi:hypothetical protein